MINRSDNTHFCASKFHLFSKEKQRSHTIITFQEKVSQKNENIIKDIKMIWEENISNEIDSVRLKLSKPHLQDLLQKYRDIAFNQVI